MNFALIARYLPHIIVAVSAVEAFVAEIDGANLRDPKVKAASLKLLAATLPAVEGVSGGRIDLDDAKVAAAVGDVFDALVSVLELVRPEPPKA